MFGNDKNSNARGLRVGGAETPRKHTVRSSIPAEGRCSQKWWGWLLIKNCIGRDDVGRALISDDTAMETAPAARRRERDDESHDDIHAHGPIIDLSDSPAVSTRLARHRRDAPAELIVVRRRLQVPRPSLNRRDGHHIGCNYRVAAEGRKLLE